jgi:hypothetical protein
MNRTRFLLLALVLPVGLALILGVVAVARHLPQPPPDSPRPSAGTTPPVSAPAWDGPSPAKEGEEWNHRELFDYLKTRGVDCYYRGKGGLSVWACENATEDDRINIAHIVDDPSMGWWAFDNGYVSVTKAMSAAAAKDAGGTSQHSFWWGRFIFRGKDEPLARFKAALGAQP